jgi:hypothetical protein
MTKSNGDADLAHDEPVAESARETNGAATAMRGLLDNARVAKDALRGACRGASATAAEFGEEAYQIGSKTTAQLTRQVVAQPMTSMLVAGSLGLIAGVLLTRR